MKKNYITKDHLFISYTITLGIYYVFNFYLTQKQSDNFSVFDKFYLN